MSRMLLDSSFVIAAKLERDQNHEVARQYWLELLRSDALLTTTSFILDEIATFLNARGDHAAVVEAGEILSGSPSVDVDYLDSGLFRRGWAHFKRHGDKGYSLTDCISFVVMQDLGLTRALTFDRHFVQAAFEAVP